MVLTPWIEEAKRRLSGPETSVVEESDDGGENRHGGGGATGKAGVSVDDYCVAVITSISAAERTQR